MGSVHHDTCNAWRRRRRNAKCWHWNLNFVGQDHEFTHSTLKLLCMRGGIATEQLHGCSFFSLVKSIYEYIKTEVNRSRSKKDTRWRRKEEEEANSCNHLVWFRLICEQTLHFEIYSGEFFVIDKGNKRRHRQTVKSTLYHWKAK